MIELLSTTYIQLLDLISNFDGDILAISRHKIYRWYIGIIYMRYTYYT